MAQRPIVEERKTYANPILYLRKSKKGEHLYAFNVNAKNLEGEETEDMVLGGNIGSLILNVSDVEKLLADKLDWVKVSVVSAE